jgi:hypothetical protein
MMCGFNGTCDCIKAFSETDMTEYLKGMDIPVLVLDGEGDHIVSIGDNALKGDVEDVSRGESMSCVAEHEYRGGE